MYDFKVGQQDTSIDGHHVTILEVLPNGLLVKATTGSIFTIRFEEFKVAK